MKLYNATGACSLAVHIALREIEATRTRVHDALRAEGLVK